MTLLYAWMLFFLIPLFLFYKNQKKPQEKNRALQQKLFFLVLFFIILALCRPVLTKKADKEAFYGDDYIIALDSSYSMQADDLYPSRFVVSKKNISSLLNRSSKDRFSLFTFTTNTMLISPPTTDKELTLLALNSIEPKYILTKGTSLLELFKTVAKTSYRRKNLILFSDGGEEQNLQELLAICKSANIVPYVVAVGSKSGAALKKNGKILKDKENNLVISRINPLLKTIANATSGKYYELDSNKDISSLIRADLQSQTQKVMNNIEVLRYKELYQIPLLIAITLFFLAVTKFHQIYILIALVFIPYPSKAATIFDFYYLNEAKKSYKEKKFLQSAQNYLHMTPSVQTYYNAAVALYKAQKYKKAIQLFLQIKTSNIKMKQNIYYNIANAAFKLKKYKQAQLYYLKALNLGEDKDAYANLILLYKYKLLEKKSFEFMKKKSSTSQKETKGDSKNTKSKNNKQSANSSSQKALQKSSQSANNSSDYKERQKQQKEQEKPHFKIGYRAYELINKGYTNETTPW